MIGRNLFLLFIGGCIIKIQKYEEMLTVRQMPTNINEKAAYYYIYRYNNNFQCHSLLFLDSSSRVILG